MNKEQLLETLKGLTEALEGTTTTTPASGEDLYQAYCAGVRYVLDDLRHADSVTKEISWNISPEDGNEEYGCCQVEFYLHKEFLQDVGSWGESFDVKSEKYVESINKDVIASQLCDIGVGYNPDQETDTTDETNPETPNA